jgi:probable HAF family extracellular repeat protein
MLLADITIIDVGSPDHYGNAFGINASGQVVGSSDSAGFLWSGGVLTNVGGTNAQAINASGQVAGYNSQGGQAILYSGGVTTYPLSSVTTYSPAYGINDSGEIVGGEESATNPNHINAYSYLGGVMTDLGLPAGFSDSIAMGVNNSGQVVGYAYAADGSTHAFLYSAGVMVDLGALAGNFSEATAVNNIGQVVGQTDTPSGFGEAFLFSGGIMKNLGFASGCVTGVANGINDSSQVVGLCTNAVGQEFAVMYSCGAWVNLNSLLPVNSGWQLITANAINDSGQIVGQGILNGQYQAFLLDTQPLSSTPEPGYLALLGVGVILTLRAHQRVEKLKHAISDRAQLSENAAERPIA